MSRVPLGLVVLSLIFASSMHAQVIRSYEGLDRNAAEGVSALMELRLDGRAGNVDYLDFGVTGGVSYREPAPGHWLRLYPSFRVRRSEKQSVVREWSAHLRHSYVFSDETRTYAFAQIQADRSIDLDRRFLIGGGLRRQIMPLGDGSLDIGVGLMREDETLASGETGTALRGANLLSASGEAGIVEFEATDYYQPVMSNLGDYRVFAYTGIQIPVSDRVRFVLSGSWRRDSRPPPDIEADDAEFGFSIRLSTP